MVEVNFERNAEKSWTTCGSSYTYIIVERKREKRSQSLVRYIPVWRKSVVVSHVRSSVGDVLGIANSRLTPGPTLELSFLFLSAGRALYYTPSTYSPCTWPSFFLSFFSSFFPFSFPFLFSPYRILAFFLSSSLPLSLYIILSARLSLSSALLLFNIQRVLALLVPLFLFTISIIR